MRRIEVRAMLALVILGGCEERVRVPPEGRAVPGPASQPASRPVPWTPDATAAPGVSWDLTRVKNLGRLGQLTPRQSRLLEHNGFFLAPTPSARNGAHNTKPRATHLFHVYERNDYIAFPSLVTTDLAIDATHAYFDAVMREVEQRHLAPRLRRALEALMQEAEAVRRGARTPPAQEAARRAVLYFGVALHLMVSPAVGDAPDEEAVRSAIPDEQRPRPRQVRAPRLAREVPDWARSEVERAVTQIQAARGRLSATVLRATTDLTQMCPRGHYNRSGVLQRYFRAMSWLGMASFHVTGPEADVPALVLMVRAWLGSKTGQTELDRVLQVTTFFAGGSDAADLRAAARRIRKQVPDVASAGADALVTPQMLARVGKALQGLPRPRIQLSATAPNAPPQVRVMGRRAFEDTVGMQQILGELQTMVRQGRESQILPRVMGALGSAAVLGSAAARREVLAVVAADERDALGLAVSRGQDLVARVDPGRWDDDAYHGTLHALRPLLQTPPKDAPALLRTEAWGVRALQAFAAGWAELRHDTILYGEQLGAECDAPDPPPPPGWIEPLPEVYARLGAMVGELDRRFEQAGIPRKAGNDTNAFYRPLSEKATLVLRLLSFLEKAARHELSGKPLTRAQRRRITLIGGEVEWLMITLADTDLLQPRDQDMAVVADVFTWRPMSQVVEVAVAHPDLIYAVIDGPKGQSFVARGAVMSYREFLQPAAQRMTDEAWRVRLAAGKAPARPGWVDPIYAEPVPAIRLRGSGVERCGVQSGRSIDL